MNPIIAITILIEEGLAPLCHRYATQSEPQDAYLELDPSTRIAKCEWNPVVGSGVPESVWNHVTPRYPVSCYADGPALRKLLEDEPAQTLLDRIIAGHRIEWVNGNRVGRMDEDGQAAEASLVLLLDRVDQVQAVEPSDWFADVDPEDMGIMADAGDDDLREMADALVADSAMSQVHLIGGVGAVTAYLQQRRDQAEAEAKGR